MAKVSKKLTEEFDLTNEVLYNKKKAKKEVSDAEKKEVSPSVEPVKDEDKDLELEILTGKTVKPAKITKLSKEDQEDVDMVTELLGNTKKKKKSEPGTEENGEKKPGKKFNRDEYFGL